MAETYGIVRSVGWEIDDETGMQVFRAIIDFPKGAPDLPMSVVFQQRHVDIVTRPIPRQTPDGQEE